MFTLKHQLQTHWGWSLDPLTDGNAAGSISSCELMGSDDFYVRWSKTPRLLLWFDEICRKWKQNLITAWEALCENVTFLIHFIRFTVKSSLCSYWLTNNLSSNLSTQQDRTKHSIVVRRPDKTSAVVPYMIHFTSQTDGYQIDVSLLIHINKTSAELKQNSV